MNKAIVLGANGFIGSALVRELLIRDIYVIAVGREGSKINIPDDKRVKFISVDMVNIKALSSLIDDRDIDVFYHLAWAGSAGPARADVKLQLKNVQWTIDCLYAAKELGCKRFVGAGSIMEKEIASAASTQGSRPSTAYSYGGGKLMAHIASKAVAAEIGIEHVWPIITNAYGEGEHSPRFINTTIRKIINNESLEFTAATQNYDFVHISDVARAFYLIGEQGKPFCEYLIGSSNARPLKEFIQELCKSLTHGGEVVFGGIPFTGINLPLDMYDCSAIEGDTGFKAEISFADGVKRTMEWIKGTEVV